MEIIEGKSRFAKCQMQLIHIFVIFLLFKKKKKRMDDTNSQKELIRGIFYTE